MRKLKIDEPAKEFVRQIFLVTFDWMDSSDVEKLHGMMAEDVIRDIKETADPDEWNSVDVKIAIRRVLFEKLGIES